MYFILSYCPLIKHLQNTVPLLLPQYLLIYKIYSSFTEPSSLCYNLTLVIEIVAMMEGGSRSWNTSYNWWERASELSSKWKAGNGACWFSMGCLFWRLRRRLREVASIKNHDLLHSSPSWPVSWSEIHPGVSIQSHMISNHCKWSWHNRIALVSIQPL